MEMADIALGRKSVTLFRDKGNGSCLDSLDDLDY